MDLLEYQAKELFSQIGIPVLLSQSIEDPSELKRLQIPYPVVLKSQVRAGGRGRAGGIRFVENTIDAIAAARTIFNLPIMGEFPEVLLAEVRYNAQQEIFLAVVLDYQLQRPVLLGSVKGGINVEELLSQLQKVVVDEEFSPFYARQLAVEMGLQGPLIQSVSTIVEKMYHLFWEKDLDLVEINPLGVSADGEVMALDGKIAVNDSAIERHADIALLVTSKKIHVDEAVTTVGSKLSGDLATLPEPRWLDGIDEKGNIGIVSNSVGLALTTWDLIIQERGKPACCLIIGEQTNGKLLRDAFGVQQLEQALDRVMEISGLKVIVVNILDSPDTIEALAQAIADYLRPQTGQTLRSIGEDRILRATGSVSTVRGRGSKPSPKQQQSVNLPQLVVRLIGGDINSLEERFVSISVNWTKTLDQAVSQAISLARAK
jgi:succinyl-CoA synthetase beta subunit